MEEYKWMRLTSTCHWGHLLNIDLINRNIPNCCLDVPASNIEEITQIWSFVGSAARVDCLDAAAVLGRIA